MHMDDGVCVLGDVNGAWMEGGGVGVVEVLTGTITWQRTLPI